MVSFISFKRILFLEWILYCNKIPLDWFWDIFIELRLFSSKHTLIIITIHGMYIQFMECIYIYFFFYRLLLCI